MIDTLTTTYVIMEYVPGEDLEKYLRALGCLKEEEARPVFQQVVSAVYFLQQRHIAHRNIKLENILVDAARNAKLSDFGMAIKTTEGQMLEETCDSLLYRAPEILARKPYDGLAVDMWSLGIVLYVLVTGHFPYVEATIEDMHRIITTTMCPIPYHLSFPCHIIIARLLGVPTWFRMTIHQLVERPWLGHIQDHGLVATKEILPRIINTMCTIGYTCEEIVSSLTYRRLKDEVMATFNILKYQLSYGDSHQQVEKPWANNSLSGVLIPLPHLKRRASEPTFSTCIEARKSHFQDENIERRSKSCINSPILTQNCPERMPNSDDPVPESDALTADVTNSATGDIVVNIDSTDCMPGEPVSPVSDYVGPTASKSRSLTVWRRISRALKALCCCCCCCLPSPR
uniref:non-specific serine/threonine protein kinase n=1 Tax=Mus musculus TaxID=10090 RepID=Q32M05_MOUSE|nr:RIKEN cDNA 4932415M13 gene [Mus musculus]AAI16729.1 RIKEN cDNA 4932415M13 gene [Mus musculus]